MKTKSSLFFWMRIIVVFSLILFAITVTILGMIKLKHAFLSNSKRIREEYINIQKENIRHQVMHVIKTIEFEKEKMISIAKKQVKKRVYNAYNISKTVYERNKYLTNDTITKMIADVLRSLEYDKGNGYFFIVDINGKVILHGANPSIEGKSCLFIKNNNGEFVVKKMLTIALKHKEGFYEYYWSKPNKADKEFKKMSFVKFFEPLKFVIGTGIYFDDVKETSRGYHSESVCCQVWQRRLYFYKQI